MNPAPRLELFKKLVRSPIAACNLVAFQAITAHLLETNQCYAVAENDLDNAIKAYCPALNREYLTQIPIGMLTIEGLEHIRNTKE